MNDLHLTHSTPSTLDSTPGHRFSKARASGSAIGDNGWAPAPAHWGTPRHEQRSADPLAEGAASPSGGPDEVSFRFVTRSESSRLHGSASGPDSSASDPLGANEVLASAAAELSPTASSDPSVRALVSVGLVAAGAAFGHAFGVASIVVCALIFVTTLVVAEHEKNAKLATPAGFARLSTPAQPAQRCPLCRDGLSAREHALACPGCSTAYHLDCLQEIGGCTVVGCAGEAGSLKPGSPHAGRPGAASQNSAPWGTG